VSFYGPDVARAHDAGFGDQARGAARELLARLAAAGLHDGLVVDLGCGSGILAKQISAAGYDVLGVDLSEAMLALGRRRVPAARFARASVHDAAIPPCVGVAAVGEVLNYATDPRAGRAAAAALFARAAGALAPGGVLLFDAAAPGRGAARSWTAGRDWVVCADARTAGTTLTREVVAFHREGDAWKRTDERHELQLLAEDDVLADLAGAGLDAVERLDAYADVPLPAGQPAYAARRSR
jgi:SAM-dependent methyltransferase